MNRGQDQNVMCAEPALNYSRHRISQSLLPRDSVKRRKTDGLNSRFDRMIETVNVVHTGTSNAGGRRRRATSGSSSTVSYGMPGTPVDAYHELDESHLGQDFSVIKLKAFSREQDSCDTYPEAPSANFPYSSRRVPSPQIPDWLSQTVSTLGPQHPLRDLIPSSDAHIPSPIQHASHLTALPMQTQHRQNSPTEDVFAFNPPEESHTVSSRRMDSARVHAAVSPSPSSSGQDQPQTTILLANGSHIFSLSPSTQHKASTLESNDEYYAPATLFPPGSAQELQVLESDNDSPDQYKQLEHIPFSTPGPLARSTPHQADRVITKSWPPLLSPSFSLHERSHSPEYTLPCAVSGLMAQRHVMYSPLVPPGRSLDAEHRHIQQPTSIDFVPSNQRDDLEDTALSDDGPTLSEYTPTSSPPPASPVYAVPRQQDLQISRGLLSSARYATPQIAQQRTYRVYFDSPAEDPIGSDPLEPPEYELEINCDALGFRWEKFDRSGERTSNESSSSSVPDPADALPRSAQSRRTDDDARHIINRDLDEYSDRLLARSNDVDRVEVSPVHSSVSISDVLEYPTEKENMPITMTPTEIEPSQEAAERSQAPPFAPGPGIFLSPLQGETNENQPPAEPVSEEQEIEISKAHSSGKHDMAPQVPSSTPPPKTPPNQVASAIPRTPVARRISVSRPRMPSVPPIAALKTEEDDILDTESEPKLSQASHDTIESWSAP